MMGVWLALVGASVAGPPALPVAWTPDAGTLAGTVGQADWAAGQFDADPRPDGVALVQSAQGVVGLEIVLNGGETVRRVALAAPTLSATLAVADADGDGLDDLALGQPLADGRRGFVNVFFDVAGLPDASLWASAASVRQLVGSNTDQLGAAMVWLDGDADGELDLMLGAPGAAFGVGGVRVYDVVDTPAGADPLWSVDAQGGVFRLGDALAVRPAGPDLLVLGCVGSVDGAGVCGDRAAWTFASDGSEAAVGAVFTTKGAATLIGKNASAAVSPVALSDGSVWLTGTTRSARLAASGPPVEEASTLDPLASGGLASVAWQGVGHTAWVQGGVLSVYAGVPQDGGPLTAAALVWPALTATRVRSAGDWDADGCDDVWVGTDTQALLLAGDCTPPSPQDTAVQDSGTADSATPDTDTDTDTDTDAVLDTDGAPTDPVLCEPSFGWSCAAAPIRSEAPVGVCALLVLAWRRRRGRLQADA